MFLTLKQFPFMLIQQHIILLDYKILLFLQTLDIKLYLVVVHFLLSFEFAIIGGIIILCKKLGYWWGRGECFLWPAFGKLGWWWWIPLVRHTQQVEILNLLLHPVYIILRIVKLIHILLYVILYKINKTQYLKPFDNVSLLINSRFEIIYALVFECHLLINVLKAG